MLGRITKFEAIMLSIYWSSVIYYVFKFSIPKLVFSVVALAKNGSFGFSALG
jgi:hypothetical protein